MQFFVVLPNVLTFLRILLIPVLVGTFYFDTWCSRKAAVFIFVIACLTDFFDGYLARKWNQTSQLGQILDPIADKLLISSTLLFLAGFHRLSLWGLIPASIILCREMLISGVRDTLAFKGIIMPVVKLAKWKTSAQMLSISFLLLGDATPFHGFNFMGEVLLWGAALLTVLTGYLYVASLFKKISSES